MKRTCTTCDVVLHGSNRCGVCWDCQNKRTCSDCGDKISYRSKGRCQACTNAIVNADPDKRASMSVAMKRSYADPEVRAQRLASVRSVAVRMMQDPAYAARCSLLGRTVGARNFEKGRTVEVARKRAPAVSAGKLAHIHPAYRELYKTLRGKHFTAAESLQMVEDQRQQTSGTHRRS